MKLSDFFLGSRQLFGFLAPGSIWLASLFLLVFNIEPISLFEDLSGWKILFFFAASLVVGTAIETLSFNISVRLSAWIHGQNVSREEGDLDYFPSDVDKTLMGHARDVIAKDYQDLTYTEGLNDREFSQLCRRHVLNHSSTGKERIIEYESEVNLLSMLFLPLLIFSAAWGFHSAFQISGLTIFERGINIAKISLPSLIVAGLLLFRLHPLRREESEYWFQSFLSLHLETKK